MTKNVETERPDWTYGRMSTKVWVEDDVTCSLPDHEGLSAAWRRLYGAEMPEPAETWDAGDASYMLIPGDLVAISSYPGNSEIRQLVSKPVNGVCCACGFAGDEETDCLKTDNSTHCDHWFEAPDGDGQAPSGQK